MSIYYTRVAMFQILSFNYGANCGVLLLTLQLARNFTNLEP